MHRDPEAAMKRTEVESRFLLLAEAAAAVCAFLLAVDRERARVVVERDLIHRVAVRSDRLRRTFFQSAPLKSTVRLSNPVRC